MFLATVDPNDYPNYAGPTVTNFPTEFGKAVKEAFSYKRVEGFFIQLEKDTNSMVKNLTNGIVGYQKSMSDAIFETYRSTQDLGVSMKEVTDYFTSYGNAIGKIPNISKEATKQAVILSKATGIAVTEIAASVAKFSEVGIGQKSALDRLTKIYQTARKYGVDSGALTKTVSENIKMASTYGFKGGVEGLTKMAARAQQLGLEFKLLNGVVEKALDPDKAIELAASMQMLGGNVGALGDPFQLLYMAQNDIGKLQEEFINVTSSAVDFNEATGEFKVPVSEMYRLRSMSESLGLNYDQIAEAAVKAAKQKEVLSRITFPSTVSEEDQNLIASLSEINNGKVQITLPGTKELVDVANLSQAQIDQFKEAAITDNMSMEDIAKRQLSESEKAAISLNKIENAMVFTFKDKGYDQNILTNLGKETAAANAAVSTAQFKDSLKTVADTMNTVLTTTVEAFSDYLTNQFPGDVATLITKVNAFTAATATTPITTTPVSDLYVPSKNAAPTLMSKGQMFTGIPEDDVLFAPKIGEFIQSSSNAFETLQKLNGNDNMKLFELVANSLIPPQKPTESLGLNMNNITETQSKFNSLPQQAPQNNIEDMLSKNLNRLNEFQNQTIQQNISTTQKVEGNVGVDGNVNINVNIPNGLLSSAFSGDREFQQSIKDEIMNVVNDRLSKAYSQRQGNFSS